MRQNYKRLLAALVLMSATQTSSVVQAEGIRLVGPSGEVQASPSYAEEIERALPAPPENDQPSRFFGPTGQNETLWSIASELRPSRNVSVQQTLLAIYRINPQAFDKQNIHELIPGSRLRVPSLEQVQSATTAQAIAIMKAHEARLTQPKPTPAQPVKPKVEPPKPVVEAPKPEPKPESVKPETPKPEPIKAVEPTTPVPAVSTSPEGEKQVSALKDKLQGSQSELESLEEKNHRLRLMLSEVQSEVETLKTSLNDEERIRSEVEKLLAEERQRVAEQQRMQPSTMDKILTNGWLVGLAALIPGALIALLVVMLLGRRSKAKEEEAAAQEQQNVDPLAAPIGLAAADELDEELSLDDDLFGDDDETENLFEQEEQQPEEEDVFGNLDDDDLDFNLEGDDGEDPFAGIGDDGELDVGFDEFDSSSNGIKVNGEEKALGLEEMERALDEVTPELEVLDDDDDAGFDLSDEDGSDAMSDDAFAELLAADDPAEELQSNALDQAMLDDLFADLDGDDLNLDVEDDKPTVSETAFSAGEATDDDIDKLLAQYEQPTPKDTDDDLFDELETLSGLSDSDSSEEEASALLDELIGEDDGEPLNELDPLEELEDIAGLSEEPTIDEDSTDLLDELIGFDDEDASDDDFDPLDELEKLSGFDGDDSLEDIDENSVDLLDELLSDESVEEQDETSSEIDPFDELIREDDELEQAENKLSDDDLLASLGFDDLEPEAEESVQQPQLMTDVEPAAGLEEEKAALGLDSGLDIDALLSENQPEVDSQTPVELPSEPIEQEQPESIDDFDSHDFLGDLEDVSPEHDPLMTELDELFESNNEALLPNEQERSDFAAELDALIGEEPAASENADQQPEAPAEPLVEGNELAEKTVEEHSAEVSEALDPQAESLTEASQPQEETMVEPETEPAPTFTPTPNTVENEFGIPQEEDWLVDEIEPENKIEQEPVAASSTESAIDEEEFNFDELELPEFNEEDALASMAEEPAQAESEIAEPQAPVAEAEEEFNFDELELPEFNEEDALASMAEDPALTESEIAEPQAPVAEAEEEFNFDELELPEFNEEDALASMAEEPALAESEVAEPQAPVAETKEEFNFDELELPEFNEEDALASMAEEPALAESEIAEPAAPVAEAEEEFNFDELELPEFNEEDALASMAEEPALAESEIAEPEAPVAEVEEEFNFDEFELPEFNEEDALASMAEEPALAESEIAEPQAPIAEAEDEFNFDDFELPEFNEEDALASVTEEVASSDSDTVEPEVVKEHSEVSQAVQQAENDHDALFEVFAQPDAFSADLEPEPSNDLESELNDFEESAMANLLSENAESEVFDGKLDSDTIASAGMDFETMLDVGDDWDGFKLSPENTSSTAEVPEDQREVWSSSEALAQPEIAQENWGEQDDLTDFDPKKNQFMTIDELMAQVDKDGGEFEEQELKLDVGLNEFPDVIGDIGDVDVDTNAEAAGKLDLAKIYLEMNDPQGAIKLLEEAIVYGEDDIRREAKTLIDTINGR
ncbi:FimV/HubP family polar landmark protein [Vibrio owensii]|uniref:FimV/HubP family polar landmark protein n=1 Tax=Vibrio owensii TaxID=696485 RepID=UPI00099735C4|nr:FimV/HubP family polar landmark protein [Vibrio owensii]AQW58939.1 AAA family ATPase [Vibrio owensii]